MTINELIKKLEKMDGNSLVVFEEEDNGYSSIGEINAIKISVRKPRKVWNSFYVEDTKGEVAVLLSLL